MSSIFGIGFDKLLFNKIDARDYFDSFYKKMKTEVDQMSDAEIVSCNFDEWTNYLAEKYYVVPITIIETSIEKTLSKSRIRTKNPNYGYPGEGDFIEIDGVTVTFKIPYDGDPDLFGIKPNKFIALRYETQSFVKPQEEYGSFTIELKYTEQELQSQGENIFEYVQKQFDNKFKSYKTIIGYVNDSVSAYNSSLVSKARNYLEERKKKADSFFAISNALQIPLIESKNAPNTKPIHLNRIVRQPPTKPKFKPVTAEMCIGDEDYENINNIIFMCGTTMEKTARTYLSNNEEELRDHLLATLNTHYENATGETFRRIGKTDIQIEFENKAAFIGECKIWYGERKFQEAIQQVINYSTWRDLKVSVIIFNKNNQSFPTILTAIDSWVKTNAVSYTQREANAWICAYHRQDMNVDIKLTVLAFDLYLDTSQFSDRRYLN